MKLPTTLIDTMQSKIAPNDTPENREYYLSGKFPQADKVKDLDKRYRWDLLYSAFTPVDICRWYDTFDCSDSHIDSALRQIVHKL
jgi:hypothetical protein